MQTHSFIVFISLIVFLVMIFAKMFFYDVLIYYAKKICSKERIEINEDERFSNNFYSGLDQAAFTNLFNKIEQEIRRIEGKIDRGLGDNSSYHGLIDLLKRNLSEMENSEKPHNHHEVIHDYSYDIKVSLLPSDSTGQRRL